MGGGKSGWEAGVSGELKVDHIHWNTKAVQPLCDH